MNEVLERLEIQLLPMPWEVQAWLLHAHVAFVVACCLAAAVALVAPHGGVTHRRAGKVFVTALIPAMLTVLPAVAMPPISMWTGLATLYLAWRGLWWIDRVGHATLARGLGLALGVGALPYAAWIVARGDVGQAVGVVVFDAFLAGCLVRDLRRDRAAGVDIAEHLTGMILAVALMAENFLPRRLGLLKEVLPELLVSLLPLIVASVALVRLRARVRSEGQPAVASSGSPAAP